VLEANYLTIPVYIVAVLILAAVTYLSDRLKKRAIIGVCTPIPVIIGYGIAMGTSNLGTGYFAMILCSAVSLVCPPFPS
jgi:hypothetical protein